MRKQTIAIFLFIGFSIQNLCAQTWVDSVDAHGREVFMSAVKYKWDWGQATFLHSLVRLYDHASVTDQKKYVDYIKTAMDATYAVANGKHPNAVASAHGMAFLARITGDQKYWQKCNEIYKDYLNTPRCSNGGVSHRAETKELWDDTVFMLSMFLLEMYKSTGDEKYLADFLEQFKAHDEKLTDTATGLWVHAWDSDNDDYDDGCSQKGWPDKTTRRSSEIWARGNAWIGMALSDALRTVGRKSSYWKPFEKAFKNYVSKMEPYQDQNSGMWYQLITLPENPNNFLESSCTAMLAYTISSGLELNILPKKKYEQKAAMAYAGLKSRALRNPGDGPYLIPTLVSGGTCVGDQQYYLTRKIGEGTGFGYGSFILFGQSYEHYKGWRK
jgi:unsaturated rhamnogalacturonyl hydrolase